MRLLTWFSYAKISSLSKGFTVLSAGALLFGCVNRSNDPKPVSEDVQTAVSVLGEEPTVTGGVQLSSIYRSFLAHIEEGIVPESTAVIEQNRIILERLGIDPAKDDVSIFFAFEKSGPSEGPRLILNGPVPTNALDSLVVRWENFELLDSQSAISQAFANALPIYEWSSEDASLYIAIPESQTLALAASPDVLAQMLDRLRADAEERPMEQRSLVNLVGAADVWLVTEDIPALLDALSIGEIPDEFGRIVMAIANVAGSGELEDETLNMNLFLEPRSRVQAQDLSDLIRGAIALVKLTIEDHPQLVEVVEQIRVSEYQGFSRVQLKMRETDFRNLMELTTH